MKKNKTFMGWLAWLRAYYPMQLVCKVHIVPDDHEHLVGKYDGRCIVQEYTNRRAPILYIYIAESLDEKDTLDTLKEEYTHGLRHHLPWIGDPVGDDDGIFKRLRKNLEAKWEEDHA